MTDHPGPPAPLHHVVEGAPDPPGPVPGPPVGERNPRREQPPPVVHSPGPVVHSPGPGVAGGRVVLVHGFTQTLAAWAPAGERLARRWAEVRVDLPGHGGSNPTLTSLDPHGYAGGVMKRCTAHPSTLTARCSMGRRPCVSPSRQGGRTSTVDHPEGGCAPTTCCDKVILRLRYQPEKGAGSTKGGCVQGPFVCSAFSATSAAESARAGT